MDNTTNIDNIKQDLDLVFEALYAGLNNVADKVRSGESPDTVADEIEALASDFCRRWPTCRTAHNLDPAPGSSY
jgi:hypothetical protein